MSSSNTSSQFEQRALDLDDDTVKAWLQKNSDFLVRFPEVLTELHLPDGQVASAISMQQFQLRAFRQEKQRLQNAAMELQTALDNAEGALSISEKLFHLSIELLGRKTQANTGSRVTKAVREVFDYDACSLIKCTADKPTFEVLEKLLGDPVRSCCGQALDQDLMLLTFGPQKKTVLSYALVPVFKKERLHAVLALGAFDVNRFHADMGRRYLEQLGHLVAETV